ncbi:MAG: response regulator [Anaerolineaceae bacterium]|nr:response regulator [Anaerolineaceae bacterium]
MMTILIVDDDYMNRELLQAHMENARHSVLLANSGAKALEMAAAHLPDIILMDVNMPGLSGYSVCNQLKRSPITQHIPVLLMTAMDDDENIAQAAEVGADGFVSKPFNIERMFEQINRLLAR